MDEGANALIHRPCGLQGNELRIAVHEHRIVKLTDAPMRFRDAFRFGRRGEDIADRAEDERTRLKLMGLP
jgi:hypothetical protein